MAELVRGFLPRSKVIFISAYDNFDYAVQALKPVDKKKLAELVMKAVRRLDEEGIGADAGKGRIAVLTLILNNLMMSDSRIQSLLERAGIVFSSFFALSTDALELWDEGALSSLLSDEGIGDRAQAVGLYLSNRLIISFFLRDEVGKVPGDFVVSVVKRLERGGLGPSWSVSRGCAARLRSCMKHIARCPACRRPPASTGTSLSTPLPSADLAI
ncbi:MAG: hypothetical protein NT061_07880 [Spirochaetes bacterium]|nr:hypothetical protein [Spirochaetota bacterium]